MQKLCELQLFLVMTKAAAMPSSTEAAEHSKKIFNVISVVMTESSTERSLLSGLLYGGKQTSAVNYFESIFKQF